MKCFKKDTHTLGPMRKKQSTNFIILSLQRHKPLYPQNISLKNKTKTQNSFLMTICTDRSNKKKGYREETEGEGQEGAVKCEGDKRY